MNNDFWQFISTPSYDRAIFIFIICFPIVLIMRIIFEVCEDAAAFREYKRLNKNRPQFTAEEIRVMCNGGILEKKDKS